MVHFFQIFFFILLLHNFDHAFLSFLFFSPSQTLISFFICHTNSKKQVMFSDGLVLDFLIFIINLKNQLCQVDETLLKPVLEMHIQREHTVQFILSITGHIYITLPLFF